MNRRCIIAECGSIMGCYAFPTDVDLRSKWCEAIRRPDFVPTDVTGICRRHFLSGDFASHPTKGRATKALKPRAVPSHFPWSAALVDSGQRVTRRAAKRLHPDSSPESLSASSSVSPVDNGYASDLGKDSDTKDSSDSVRSLKATNTSKLAKYVLNGNDDVEILQYQEGDGSFKIKTEDDLPNYNTKPYKIYIDNDKLVNMAISTFLE